MNDQKQAVIDKLKSANNILVTVSTNPSVDQLAACIGLTLLLNKLKKHATAVFSGEVPSTIEFLQPENTLERNTDSLRDFIISLDKSKADKLRYKVEENVVKIFITPYRTSINQEDLEFSQGDFNVDVVIALGVHEQQQLDDAITMHGRILHDATVMSVNTATGADLGSINWTEPSASSLSELAMQIAKGLSKDLIDGQIATSFLTGIVAETARFSNEKTSPETMKLSAELLTAGANQQLVANELGHGESASPPPTTDDRHHLRDQGGPGAPPKPDDGTLEISHPQAEADEEHQDISHDDKHEKQTKEPEKHEDFQLPEPPIPGVRDVKQNTFEDHPSQTQQQDHPQSQLPPPHYLTEPPHSGSDVLGMTAADDEDERIDMMGEHHDDIPLLDRNKSSEPPAWQPQVITPTKDEPKSVPPAPKPEEKAPEHEPQLVKEPVHDEKNEKRDAGAYIHPEPKADTYEPLASEPKSPPWSPAPKPAAEPPKPDNQIHIDTDGNIKSLAPPPPPPPAPEPRLVTIPASPGPTGAPPDTTLAEIEKSVHSPHTRTNDIPAIEPLKEPTPPPTDLNAARNAVMDAINGAPQVAAPKQNVGAGGYLSVQDLPAAAGPAPSPAPAAPNPAPSVPSAPATYAPPMNSNPPAVPPPLTPAPATTGITLPSANPVPLTTPAANPTSPPPVPPPMTGV